MADELSIITTNQAGDGWVDQVPGPVSSGYQAQNTIISSTLIGIDKSEMVASPSPGSIIAEPSGPIDVDGQPYMITQRVVMSAPFRDRYFYFKVVNGITWDKKSLREVSTTDTPTYDHIRRGLYFVNSDGTRERCLNWVGHYTVDSPATPFRIAMGRPQFHIENFLDIDGLDTKWGFQFAAGDVVLGSHRTIKHDALTHGKNSVLLISKSLAAGGTFKISFTATPSGLNGYNYSIEEIPHGSSTRIVKGRRQRSGASTDNFSGTYFFSPYSRILLYADIHYRGIAGYYTHLTISNFKVSVSRRISPLMRHLLNLNDF